MKLGRETKGIPPADLLVCFPSRSHLTLMPKPICSPARPPDSIKLHHSHRHHYRKKSTSAARGVQASPLTWAKAKTMESEISEPTSPKVTCAGQIKIRPKTSSCKSWQSVMEEIERIHNRRKLHKRRTNWVESFGFKKDIMQFLTCLRSIRFDLRCFKAFPESDFTTDDEDDEEEEEEDEKSQENQVGPDGSETSRTAFSKWFMVLQESQSNGLRRENREENNNLSAADDMSIGPPIAPPSNALLLMRCRSAPAKSWQEEKRGEDSQYKEETEEDQKEVKVKKSLKWLMEEENRERLVMEIDPDFYKISSDIAKETWVVSEKSSDLFSRSRSWKN